MRSEFLTYVIYPFILIFCACSTKHKTDYVRLEIPESLKDHKDIVKNLRDDEEKLNKVFNSLEDLVADFIEIKHEIRDFEESDDLEVLKKRIEKRMDEVHKSHVKLGVNIFWFIGKEMLCAKEPPANLQQAQDSIAYVQCVQHLHLQKEEFEKKLHDYYKEFEEFMSLMDTKKDLIERKLKEKDLQAADRAEDQSVVDTL